LTKEKHVQDQENRRQEAGRQAAACHGAQMAGLPESVITRASHFLAEFEPQAEPAPTNNPNQTLADPETSIPEPVDSEHLTLF